MYPNLDKPQSNLETNISQIFVKENSLTKQLKGKIPQSEVLQKKISLFGFQFKRRDIWVLSILSFLLLMSFIGVVLMWWTSMFDNYVISNFVLANNTPAFLRWKDPPLNGFMKIHIFNYTNVEEYRNGLANKLHVEDVGPFVYEETTQKTNIKFYSNSSISYQEFRTHKFRKDLSQNMTETDRVIVPNLSVLGAAAANKDAFYITRLAVSTLMRGLNADPFLNLAAHRFIWGYDDKLFDLAKNILTFKKKLPFEKFGIMAGRNGTSEDVITIHSGVNDLSKIAQIDRINGEEYMHHWGTTECNRIKGSDGAFYPIFDVRQKKPVNVYFPEVCRRIPLIFDKTVKMLNGQIEAYRYALPDTIFNSPKEAPENKCYCDSDNCSPQGVFNMSKCAFGAPASISFPHFFNADPVLQNGVTGLSPNGTVHSSYMDIHPRLGFPMSGIYRLQFNVQVKKSPGMSQLDMFDDEMYLPVAWIEAGITPNELPEFAKEAMLTLSITLPAFENAFKYGFLLTAVLSFLSLLFMLTRGHQERFVKIIRFSQISLR